MPEEIYDNIFLIRVPLPKNPLRETNCYLLRGKGRDLLIDTCLCLPPCREVLAQELDALGARTDALDILLTHQHGDHAGLAPEFVGREGRIYLSETELPWMQDAGTGEHRQHMDAVFAAAGFDEALMRAFWKESYAVPMVSNPLFKGYSGLKDGERLKAGGHALTCVETPGHTPGHMCFWMERERIMFTGDHVLFDITPNIITWAGVPDSLGDYLGSLAAIRDYPVELALPGHRGTGDFGARIDTLLRHHEKRLTECHALVAARGGQTAYEIAAGMRWKIRASSWEAFPIRQKRYATGECMAHLDRLVALSRISRELDGDGPAYRYYDAAR